jgi:hypothetical protein
MFSAIIVLPTFPIIIQRVVYVCLAFHVGPVSRIGADPTPVPQMCRVVSWRRRGVQG